MVLAVVGDIDPERAGELLAMRFPTSSADVDEQPVREVVWPTERIERQICGSGEQAHIAIGLPGLPGGDPDRPTLDVLMSVLSGQGGRLFLDLRDRQSLAYSVSASSFEGGDTGYLLAYMGTSPDKLDVARTGLEKLQGAVARALA